MRTRGSCYLTPLPPRPTPAPHARALRESPQGRLIGTPVGSAGTLGQRSTLKPDHLRGQRCNILPHGGFVACWVDGLDQRLKDSIKPKGEGRPNKTPPNCQQERPTVFLSGCSKPCVYPQSRFCPAGYFLVYTVWGSTKTSFSQERVTGAIVVPSQDARDWISRTAK